MRSWEGVYVGTSELFGNIGFWDARRFAPGYLWNFIFLGPVVLELWISGIPRIDFVGNILVGQLIPASGSTGVLKAELVFQECGKLGDRHLGSGGYQRASGT